MTIINNVLIADNQVKHWVSIIKSCNNWFDSCPLSSTLADNFKFFRVVCYYFGYKPLQVYDVAEEGIDISGSTLIHFPVIDYSFRKHYN